MGGLQNDEYFAAMAETWTERYRTSGSFQRRREIIHSLIDQYGIGGKRALDFGCGTGVLTERLACRFESVVAVDPSEAMRQKARELLIGCSRVSISNPEGIVGTPFDFILCSSVVEYVEDDRSLVRELGRMLSPSGKLLISFPNRWGIIQMATRYAIRILRRDCYARYQLHTYTAGAVCNLAFEVGLGCDEMVFEIGVPPFSHMGFSEQIFVVMGRLNYVEPKASSRPSPRGPKPRGRRGRQGNGRTNPAAGELTGVDIPGSEKARIASMIPTPAEPGYGVPSMARSVEIGRESHRTIAGAARP